MPDNFPTGILVQDAVVVTDSAGQEATIRLDGDTAGVTVGRSGQQSMLKMQDSSRNDQVWLMGNGDVVLNGSLWCGSLLTPGVRTFRFAGANGDISVAAPMATSQGTVSYNVLAFHSRHPVTMRATLLVGGGVNGHGTGGALHLKDFSGDTGILMDGSTATITLGGAGRASGKIVVRNGAGAETVRLDGQQGDIVLQNADFAEDFPVQEAALVEPGMVMEIADDGTLRPCDTAYSTRVAGIVSGAGGCKPAIVLGREGDQAPDSKPIALNGKVYCWVDADLGSVLVGDLLTSSATRGHAMKVTDPSRAFGAVLGKALAPLHTGRGLIPMIVTMQ